MRWLGDTEVEKRVKMSKSDRAKQFAPFDALKGLHDALKMKEYEHDRMQKGDLSSEKLAEMTKILLDYKKSDALKVRYFSDGYYKEKIGKAKVDFAMRTVNFDGLKLTFDDIFDVSIEKFSWFF